MKCSGFKWLQCIGIAFAVWGAVGCSSADVRNEVVARVNGEEIKISELREFLGIRGGGFAASDVPQERKKEVLDRLIAGRMLTQDARARGFDNTEEFRNNLKNNEMDATIAALFGKELEARGKPSEKEVDDEAKKLREADKNLSEKDAAGKAKRTVVERNNRKLEEDLIAEAKKETPYSIDHVALEKVGKGGVVDEGTVLATVGEEKITYGALMKILEAASPGSHSGQELAKNAVVIGRMLDREVTGKALVAYAKKKGVDKTDWMKKTRGELERNILISLLADKVVLKDIAVTDKDVEAAYKEHERMFVKEGKKVPLAEVRGQIQSFILNDRRKKALEAYIIELKKKAKITVEESLLTKV